MFNFIAKKIFGTVNDRIVKKILLDVAKINELESEISALDDDTLKAKTDEFKKRLAGGETLDQILHEAFAVVREAAKRTLNMRHFDTQLVGGIVLHQGKISEMKTGEGKTLVATLPCYLNALTGKNVMVVTVNDYLAKRDSKWMGKVHEFLGLTVGCITNEVDDEQRKDAYACDVTYATNNELGFDFLRDNMRFEIEDMVQKDHYFAIVDEVDSILIDEARTPLIISGPTDDNSALYEKINRIIPKLSKSSFILDEKDRNVQLTDEGVEDVEKILKNNGTIDEESSLYDVKYVSYVHHINQALKAHKVFHRETDYIVKEGEVVIIDEFTGRMQDGRRFSDGLHQALEAKEGVDIKNENQTLASITFQNYFRQYDKLAGMTGTALTEAVEFEEIYGLKVVEIPTNRGIARKDEDDEVYKTEKAKNDAIIASVKEAHENQQPILLGTVSIEKSEAISKILKANKLPHYVLNAKHHAKEAQIITQAGKPGAITIATNMAGRGTDIVLGGRIDEELEDAENEEERQAIKEKFEQDKGIVLAAGGLYVLGSERHESRRIDNQLRGRSGRQGDPGRSKFFLSLEDDLMRIFGSDKLQSTLSRLGLKDDEAIVHPWITRTLHKAQQKVEMRNYEIRKNLLKFDDIVNNQRQTVFELRNDIMRSQDLSAKIDNIAKEINEDLVARNIPKNSYSHQWNVDHITSEVKRIYGLDLDIKSESEKETDERGILSFIDSHVSDLFSAKRNLYGQDITSQLQRQVYLVTLDSEWKDHLLSLDKLRQSVSLRAYAQKDPLIEYKKEAFNLFEDMMNRLEEQLLFRLAHVKVEISDDEAIDLLSRKSSNAKTFETRNDPGSALQQAQRSVTSTSQPIKSNVNASDRDPNNPSTWGNVKRNELCPCGSGKKYKHCHGQAS